MPLPCLVEIGVEVGAAKEKTGAGKVSEEGAGAGIKPQD